MRHSFLLAGAAYGLTPNDNFAVLSCNNEVTKEPELTISIKATYFNANLSWLLDQACFEILYSSLFDVAHIIKTIKPKKILTTIS